MTAGPLLEVDRLTVRYGSVLALEDVSLQIGAGEVVALLGANGAGKTSLLRAISRLEPVAGGTIRFKGRPIQTLRAPDVVSLGLAHCPEGRRIFPALSVDENLSLGAYLRRDEAGVASSRAQVFEYFPVLAQRQNQPAGTLSGGEQQMLAVGRALMGRPEMLMIDELSLGLAPKLIKQIFEIVVKINREQGITVFLVEQNANEALLHSHRGYVLENGRITLHGRSEELRRDQRVAEAYFGL